MNICDYQPAPPVPASRFWIIPVIMLGYTVLALTVRFSIEYMY